MEKIEILKKVIIDKVFIKNGLEQIEVDENPNAWIMDFRRITMNGAYADLISDIFYSEYSKSYPFQLCTLEVAGITLTTSLMSKFYYNGHKDVNAFYIRKSRKKNGLTRMVEGNIENDKKIILIDDVTCTGNTFWRQIEVLEQLGFTVDSVWSIIKFHDSNYYKRFTDRGIKVNSLFDLNDFRRDLGIKNLPTIPETPPNMPFTQLWKFSAEKPSYGYVHAKSQPVIDENKIYVGSDNRVFFAINQSDARVNWKYEVGYSFGKKGIFSDPILYKNLVIFGACDGNVYALNKETGEKVWISFEADYIGSSPEIAQDLGVIFIGLQYGVFKKTGGLMAIDAESGKNVWVHKNNKSATSASPLYIKEHKMVLIGYDDGTFKAHHASTGAVIWEFKTLGKSYKDNLTYIHGIRSKAVYDKSNDGVIFGSLDGNLYFISRKDGTLLHMYSCEFGIYSSPILFENKVYFSSVDRKIHCVSLRDYSTIFSQVIDGTRVFSSPTIINGRLYIGTNASRLHELSPETGESTGYFQATERITNQPVYNLTTQQFFLPTYANEIICLMRNSG